MALSPEQLVVAQDPADDEAFRQLLAKVKESGRELLFLNGDLIAARVAKNPHLGKSRAEFWGDIASHLGCSKTFCRRLAQVARTFPDEIREDCVEPQHTWQWFAEVVKFDNPREMLQTCKGMNSRQVLDYRKSLQGSDEEKWRVVVTLRPEKVQQYRDEGRVEIPIVLPDETEAIVTVRTASGNGAG